MKEGICFGSRKPLVDVPKPAECHEKLELFKKLIEEAEGRDLYAKLHGEDAIKYRRKRFIRALRLIDEMMYCDDLEVLSLVYATMVRYSCLCSGTDASKRYSLYNLAHRFNLEGVVDGLVLALQKRALELFRLQTD